MQISLKNELFIDKAFAINFMDGNYQSEYYNDFFGKLSNELIFGTQGVVVKLSKLNLTIEETKDFAKKLLEKLIPYLIRNGAPKEVFLEIDKIQPTIVKKNFNSRTLLPHHDGGHCSYLTPSKIDVPDWDEKYRIFSTENFHTTHLHKIIQGILILDPGEKESITTYYDWIQILRDAYIYQHAGKQPTVIDLQKWIGSNIKYSLDNQVSHKNNYLNIAGALGTKKLIYHSLSLHSTAEEIDVSILEKFAEMEILQDSCECKNCDTDILRILCNILKETMGISYSQFIDRYEKKAYSEKLDLVLGNNLSLLHGGLNGGENRLILPMCYTIENNSSLEYEKYLKKLWRKN